MCRYELSVNMKYGVFNMNLSDDYKTAINTYNKVKNEYRYEIWLYEYQFR